MKSETAEMAKIHPRERAIRGQWLALCAALCLGGCSIPRPIQSFFDLIDPKGDYFESDTHYSDTGAEIQSAEPRGGLFRGFVAADEPRAAEVGRSMLAQAGSAADAVAAMYFALSVTYPSAAGLGGTGECLVRGQNGTVEQLQFQGGTQSDGMAAPANVQGMALLQARYGKLRWGQIVAPAELLARSGFIVTRASAHSLASASDKILADPSLSAVFAFQGRIAGEGDKVVQLNLADTLTIIRTRDHLADAGFGPIKAAFAPAPSQSGVNGHWYSAQPLGTEAPEAMAATTFSAIDSHGGATACAVSLGQVFGASHLDHGYVRTRPAGPALWPLIVSGDKVYFAGAAVGAAGKAALEKAASAAFSGGGVSASLAQSGAAEPTSAIYCRSGLPGSGEGCGAAPDPKGSGLALAAERLK